MDENKIWSDEHTATLHPPLFGHFFEGWSSFLQKGNTPPVQLQDEPEQYSDADDSSLTDRQLLDVGDYQHDRYRRKSSIRLGRKVMSEILEKDNVKEAIEILQQALSHLDITQQDEDENPQDVSKVYSQVIKALCDPAILGVVDEMTPTEDIHQSVLWRLFTKVVESGHVLERDAHLAVVNTLMNKGYANLALQAMYTLPRKEWDTECYRTAVLLHLMQDPKQLMDAQALISDYGKPHLEIPNPTAPSDLPPHRIEMPLMKDVTENDQLKLWMFFQAAQSKENDHWTSEREAYESRRNENLKKLDEKSSIHSNKSIDWALEQMNIESEKRKVDRKSTENDNTMIYVAILNEQFEYGWQVYEAMGDCINEETPCIVMHLCWAAFRQIPIADMSYRSEWESRAWSVYSRFMCSEYLHPDQPEAPSFIHDLLSISARSPEVTTDKRARYTKSMTVYNLLVRLQFQRLLCDDRVLEPILCTLLYECKGTPTNIVNMCSKAFEIWDRKKDIQSKLNIQQKRSPYSMMWGLLILCCKSGNENDLQKVLQDLSLNDEIPPPSSLFAPIQKFHDTFLCSMNECYFKDYMFKYVEFTDDLNTTPVKMSEYGFILPASGDTSKIEVEEYNQTLSWCTNINEPQEPNITMAAIMGAAKQEKLVQKEMYFSTKKAKAIIGHTLKLISNTNTVIE